MTQDAPMSNFSNVGTSSEETPRENGGPDKLNTEWILVSCFQSYRETLATPALGGLWDNTHVEAFGWTWMAAVTREGIRITSVQLWANPVEVTAWRGPKKFKSLQRWRCVYLYLSIYLSISLSWFSRRIQSGYQSMSQVVLFIPLLHSPVLYRQKKTSFK